MRTVTKSALALCGLILCRPVIAGELDPPAGPVAPTMKTLQQVEPRTPLANDPAGINPIVISSPGSYYLTEDIHALAGQPGIRIDVPHVRLDLRGFSVIGNRALMTTDGIAAGNQQNPISNVSIVNGVVRDHPGHGISAQYCTGLQVERVAAADNSLSGIRAGESAMITDCIAMGNGALAAGITIYGGIVSSSGSTITGCTSNGNIGYGFSAAQSSVSRCTAGYNRKYPSDPPNLSDGSGFSGSSAFSGCTAFDNEAQGFTITYGSAMNCVARSNDSSGFYADYSVLSECQSSFNAAGFSSITEATFDRCTAKYNSGNGFSVNYGGTVRDCTSTDNSGSGIWVGYDSRIIGNLCRNNGDGQAGIHAPGDSNRIEGNSVHNNAKGLHVTGTNNLIIGNSARGNTTNFDIAAGNEQGQVVVNPGMGFVNSNPWANFAY